MPIDWLTAGLAGAGIGSSLLGGLLGSQGSGDTSREALRRSTELGRNQSTITSQLMAPYVGAGNLAMQQLWGYTPTGQTGGATAAGTGGGVSTTVPTLNTTGTSWKSPTTIGGLGFSQTGSAFDRTGGAGKFMNQLESLSSDFKFDPNDPAYKYKTEESTKAIDKTLASRGMYDSRVGMNMVTDAGRAITAEEYDKQYNRKYGSLMDLFNMSGSLGEKGYQSLLDAVKTGAGAAGSAGTLGNQAAGNLMSTYGQMAQQGNIQDANQASFWSGIGSMPMNAMLLYNLLGKDGTATTGRKGW